MMDLKSELKSLLDRLFDSELTESESARLNEILNADQELRELYFHYVQIHLATVEHAEFEFEAQKPLPATIATLPSVGGVEKTNLRKASSRVSWRGVLLVAAACLVLGMLAAPFVQRRLSDTQLANDAQRRPGSNPSLSSDSSGAEKQLSEPVQRYVAEISSISADVEWGSQSSNREFLLRIRTGDDLQLEQGLVQVDYFSGASLILKGPCSYSVTGVASGKLHSGEVTGQVDVGSFLLTTPSAQVIDLGTAFGVSVDDEENTDVCVFDGKVSLSAEDESGNASEAMLTVGMAARATRAGDISTDIPYDESRFTRSIPLPPSVATTGELSLVDVMNGFERDHYRLAAGIAPDTGQAYQQEWLAQNEAAPRDRQGTYHVTNWHPMIDGVFIPQANGIGVQVDSSGRKVTLVPNGAKTSGPIWARRRIEDPSQIVFHKNFWGGATLERVLDRLGSCEWGMIGLHANVGITFDLSAIRSIYAERPILFRTVVANLDNSQEFRPSDRVDRNLVADFRLLVDGKLRRSRLGFGRSDGDLLVSVPIRDTDRFLTIVTTDAGHYWYDQVVLIDPVLVFSEIE